MCSCHAPDFLVLGPKSDSRGSGRLRVIVKQVQDRGQSKVLPEQSSDTVRTGHCSEPPEEGGSDHLYCTDKDIEM